MLRYCYASMTKMLSAPVRTSTLRLYHMVIGNGLLSVVLTSVWNTAGGAFIDEFTIRHFVKLKHPLTTLYNCVAPTKRCSVFYRTLVNIQGILRRWLHSFFWFLPRLIFIRFSASFVLSIEYMITNRKPLMIP